MPLRPDLQPDNAGGAGPRPAAARVRERSRPGDGAAPLRRRRRAEKDGGERGVGNRERWCEHWGRLRMLSSDESPVAWLLCSLAAVSALHSLDRGVVNLLVPICYAQRTCVPKENADPRERQGFSWPSDGTIGGGDKKEGFFVVLFLLYYLYLPD